MFLLSLLTVQTKAATAWSTQVVDSTGDVGRDTSMVLDSSGHPYISYLDYTNKDLKYAKWTGTAWTIQTVDSAGSVGWHSSIALDSSNNPHIAYTDDANENLKYAKWTGTTWSVQTPVSAGEVGWYPSLALDSSGNPHIVYLDYTNRVLMYTKWTGSSWATPQIVDSGGDMGWYPSLALDSSNRPCVSYYDSTNQNLKYAHWTGTAWTKEIVDAPSDVGEYSSLVLDSSGNPHISYYAFADERYLYGELRYATRSGSTWTIQTIVPAGFAVGTSSLALDSSGNPHISFEYASIQGIRSLSYVYWTGSSWSTQTVDSTAGVGVSSSIAIDSSGNARISYYDETNGNLKYAQQVTVTVTASLTLAYNPSSVNLLGTVTISGTLSSGGTGVSGKIVTVYRSSGANWVEIGATMTSTGGAYSFSWIVPSDFPSGTYGLRAVFDGDSTYPACSAESAVGLEVLPDPTTALTLTFNPSRVNKTENVTVSGELTRGGAGASGKTIYLYRSDGSGWVQIGLATTSTGGVYSYVWTVPSGLPSGYYRFKAVFNGDSGYSSSSAESDGLLEVLRTDMLTLGFSPPAVNKTETVTINGALTSEGSAVSARTINIFRSSGTGWVQIGIVATSSSGSYSCMWIVPSDLQGGNYFLKAVFDGDSDYPACSAQSSSLVKVSSTAQITITYNPIVVNKAGVVTINGVLTGDGTGVSSKTVNLFRSNGADWIQIATATTSTSGDYSLVWTVPTDLSSGYYNFRVVFNGDSSYPSCSAQSSSPIQVLPNTALTLTYSPSMVNKSGSVTINGVFTSEGTGIQGKTINLFRSNGADWVQIGTTTSSTSGIYSYTWTVPNDLTSGQYYLKAVFNGDATYPTCTVQSISSVQVLPNTALALTFNPSVVNKVGTVTIGGTFTSEGLGVSSKTITVYRSEGSSWVQIGTATTITGGIYSLVWMVPNNFSSGFYRLRAMFSGDVVYPACSVESSSSLQVLPTIQLTLAFNPSSVHNAGTVTINGAFTAEGLTIANKAISLFRSNGTNWVQIGATTSSGSGDYSYVWTVPIDLPSGNYCLRVVFNGDLTWSSCSAESTPSGIQVLPIPTTPENISAVPIILMLFVVTLLVAKENKIFQVGESADSVNA